MRACLVAGGVRPAAFVATFAIASVAVTRFIPAGLVPAVAVEDFVPLELRERNKVFERLET